MFNLFHLLTAPFGYYDYIRIDVVFIRETPRATLIIFDGKEEWFPKAWIIRIKPCKHSKSAKIKISLYHWTKKVS